MADQFKQAENNPMIRLIIKGKQGTGKTTLADQIVAMLAAQGNSVSVQDGEETVVHQQREAGTNRKIPVSVAIIVKQG